MSKKILALAAAGAMSFALVGCDLFGGDSSSSSSSSSSSGTALTGTQSVTLGAGKNSAPSYYDVDGNASFSSTLAVENGAKIDMILSFFNGQVIAPKISDKLSNLSDAEKAAVWFVKGTATTAEALDSVAANGTKAYSMDIVNGTEFVLHSSLGKNFVVKADSVGKDSTGTAMFKFTFKK